MTFKSEAQAVITNAQKDLHSVQIQLAQILESLIAEKAGVSLVPHTTGEAIGGKMSLKFTDGSFFELRLPPPDFALTFTVRGFATKNIEANSHFHDIYRVTATVGLKEPSTGHVYLNEDIYNTQIQTRHKSTAIKVAAWEQQHKTLQELLALTAEALVSPSKDFLNHHATQGSNAKAGFIQSKRVIESLKK